jgi:MFS transporter, PHS family, inorganic phosphate transporter
MSTINHVETFEKVSVNSLSPPAPRFSSVSLQENAMGSQTTVKMTNDYSVYISAISNAAIQYNLSVIGIALYLMDSGKAPAAEGYVPPAYPRTSTQDSLLKSTVFIGAILGQSCMGYAGDALGRGRALILTNVFTFVGCLASALLTTGDVDTVYTIIIVSRLLVGIGIGGKYPLSATIRAEGVEQANAAEEVGDANETEDTSAASAADQPTQHRATEVAKGFFWQTPGVIFPYALAWALVAICGEEKIGQAYQSTVSFQFRFLFGFGAVPAFMVIVLTYLQYIAPQRNAPGLNEEDAVVVENPFKVVRENPHLRKVLIGTCCSWFFYDFVYYGTAVAQPDILRRVFGNGDGVFNNCWQNILLTAMGLPGVILAILQMERLGAKRLMTWGFIMIFVTCLTLSMTLLFLPHSIVVNFSITCCLILILNWGCNVATYVLPTEAFPAEIRSSFYGLSAAGGKTGAFFGAYLFGPLSKAFGYSFVYGVCVCGALIGLYVSHSYIKPYGQGSFCKAAELRQTDDRQRLLR